MRLRTGTLIIAIAIAVCTIGLNRVNMQTSTLNEGFEAGGKTSYAAANVTLGTGSWYMSEALTGNLTSDRKTGAYAARVRETGIVRMNFNVTSAGTLTVQHARYGSDASSNWELWQSTNSGGSWSKVGATVTATSTTLQTASFTINSASAVRFEFRKVSGGAARLNLDNVLVTSYASRPRPRRRPLPPPRAST